MLQRRAPGNLHEDIARNILSLDYNCGRGPETYLDTPRALSTPRYPIHEAQVLGGAYSLHHSCGQETKTPTRALRNKRTCLRNDRELLYGEPGPKRVYSPCSARGFGLCICERKQHSLRGTLNSDSPSCKPKDCAFSMAYYSSHTNHT